MFNQVNPTKSFQATTRSGAGRTIDIKYKIGIPD